MRGQRSALDVIVRKSPQCSLADERRHMSTVLQECYSINFAVILISTFRMFFAIASFEKESSIMSFYSTVGLYLSLKKTLKSL